ncbi:hypothetical protein FB567DRAFT_458065 [Paraphoma chrysanthemicola]|uniref:C3H1-type domain-containing protein n=1 Tax=Paraphoma chrysanthemicola TaxID=798071 RepID=A0A8K0VRF6_9PLEO|nr:hypothetical protein FB567DRAFT_458065 [Paraphoma chrysanthemicola]
MDRYVPVNPYRFTYRDALRTSNVDTSLPKNFERPLTCFFWHQNGRCNKRDEDCAYAHWNTGHFAGAPINIPGLVSTGAVAGKNARNLSAAATSLEQSIAAADLQVREERLRTWEHDLKQWEQRLKEKEEDLNKAAKTRSADRLSERRSARRDRAFRKTGDCTSLNSRLFHDGS